MPNNRFEISSLSLSQLCSNVQNTIQASFTKTYWVTAEIGELKVNRTGHCYLELIEKKSSNDRVEARIRATIWANIYRMMKPYFETTTHHLFEAGIKALFNVTVEYHKIYGLSLNIRDVDPTYTMGDMARKRKEIIQRLQAEGVMNMNRELPFPELANKVAVVSSSSAAGYGDFVNQLNNNPYGYKFYVKLFEASMQGDDAEKSIVDALDKINRYDGFFDVLVIARGGGATVDLASFDSYWMAFNVSQFPIPVITGIGHDRDETVLDMVACKSVKTPTAAADFLIERMYDADIYLTSLEDAFTENVNARLQYQKSQLDNINQKVYRKVNELMNDHKMFLLKTAQALKHSARKSIHNNKNILSHKTIQLEHEKVSVLTKNRQKIEMFSYRNKGVVESFLKAQNQKLSYYKKSAEYLDPSRILKRGYSITRIDGKVIHSLRDVGLKDEIITILSEGEMKSKVTDILPNERKK